MRRQSLERKGFHKRGRGTSSGHSSGILASSRLPRYLRWPSGDLFPTLLADPHHLSDRFPTSPCRPVLLIPASGAGLVGVRRCRRDLALGPRRLPPPAVQGQHHVAHHPAPPPPLLAHLLREAQPAVGPLHRIV